MTDGWTAELVATAEDLARLEPDWWDLWRRSPAATPFSAPAWAIPWWCAFAPGRLHAAALRRDGRLVALAPTYLEDGPLGRRLLPIGIGISDHFDVLLDPADGEAAGRLVDMLVEAGGWDSWELEDLAPGAAAFSLPRPPDCAEEICDQTACPTLTPLDPDLCTVPARQRRKIRMAQHRAGRREAEVEVVGPDGMERFFAVVTDLHTARWTDQGEEGVVTDPCVRRFHLDAMPRLAAAGLVRASVLTLAGRPAGAYYGLRHGRSAYAYLGGFDPAFSFESPGTILLADAMTAAAREGAHTFHFLRGREPYKYSWGARDVLSRRRSFRRL